MLKGLGFAAACYTLGGLIVLLGVILGCDFVKPHGSPPCTGLVSRLARAWDGGWYLNVAEHGYSYDPNHQCSIGFFPAYPLSARLLAGATGCSMAAALLIVANCCFLGACLLMFLYVRQCTGTAPPLLAEYVLLALCLFPFGFTFRMGYTESLFLLISVAVLYGMEKEWPLLIIAFLVGLATATRPVGVALVAPFAVHIWQHAPSWKVFLRRAVSAVPLAFWGIVAFSLYQVIQFGDGMAYSHAQANWMKRHPTLQAKLITLITLEPFWEIFQTASPDHLPLRDSLYNQVIVNRIVFLFAGILIIVGFVRRWLSAREVALGASLWFIPYVSNLYEVDMNSAARYSSAIVPIYLVLGQLLCRLPPPLAAACLAVGSFLLGAYAALFIALYPFF